MGLFGGVAGGGAALGLTRKEDPTWRKALDVGIGATTGALSGIGFTKRRELKQLVLGIPKQRVEAALEAQAKIVSHMPNNLRITPEQKDMIGKQLKSVYDKVTKLKPEQIKELQSIVKATPYL